MLLPLLSVSLFSTVLASRTVQLFWNITYVDNVNPSTLHFRRAISVNGVWPPPPVIVDQDDVLRIHVHNKLAVGTAIHSHGILFQSVPFYDGAVGVTQCPIPPGEAMTYEIPTNRPGTYWIHGHHRGQYVDGLRTPLIIHPLLDHPSSGPSDLEDDYTVALSDWYHEEQPVLLKEYMSTNNPEGVEPVPNAPLLYIFRSGRSASLGAGNLKAIADGSAVGNRAVLKFEKGKLYRLRIVNMSALASFFFGLGGHKMEVVAVDSTDTEPFEAEVLPVSIGQRFTVLVRAREDVDADKLDWPIMANMDPEMFDEIPESLRLNITARITYSDESRSREIAPVPIYETYPPFNELDITPSVPEPSLPPDVSFDMNAYMGVYDDDTNRGSFNNITYLSPLVPSLVTALSMPAEDSLIVQTRGIATYSKIYGAQTYAITLKYNDVVEVAIRNWDDGAHPFHLHGHDFQVIEIVDEGGNVQRPRLGNANPLRRDTVTVPALGSVRIRFRANNPGAWIFHCHIEWHLESGLGNVFIEAPDVAQERFKMPSDMLAHCTKQGIPTSGNAVGLNSTTNFPGQLFGPFPKDQFKAERGRPQLVAFKRLLMGAGAAAFAFAFFIILSRLRAIRKPIPAAEYERLRADSDSK